MSLLKSITHPSEVRAMLQLIWNSELRTSGNGQSNWKDQNDSRSFSYFVLNRVSRSFAAVIQQLPPDLEDAICVFYLVLRGLDSVEDDMHIPVEKKRQLLLDFHSKLGTGTNYPGIGDTEDYKRLMAAFDRVDAFYTTLPVHYQKVIRDICRKMGFGMAEFVEKEVSSVRDYDRYCHIVAGLVGLGLTELFAVSKHEDRTLLLELDKANSMGLFLQKTNITRDYHEDLMVGRFFWPSEIWKLHVDAFTELNRRPNDTASLNALKAMVTDALRHLPDCIRYMSQLKHPDVFRFCAIPQAMAIATLAKVYNNPSVFTSNVKIRKGLAAKIMVDVVDAPSLWKVMLEQFEILERKGLGHEARTLISEARAVIEAEIMGSENRPRHYRQVS